MRTVVARSTEKQIRGVHGSGNATLTLVFSATAFLGAALLFLVQPMIGKMVLPVLGGSPSVWITAMLFFQAALLIGYGYAHLSVTRLGPRRQSLLHLPILFLPLAVLPIAIPAGWVPPTSGSPSGWLLLLLAVSVGAPFLVVSTASPLLQRWFATSDHPARSDPYFLFAISNAGSLLGLLAYPVLIEPTLTLTAQTRLWTSLYVAFAILSVTAAVLAYRRPGDKTSEPTVKDSDDRPAVSRRLRWVGAAFIASSIMLGATSFVTQRIVSAPLLWVLPLAAYLVTFIVAFGGRRSARRLDRRVLPAAILGVFLAWTFSSDDPAWLLISIHVGVVLVVGLAAHSWLAADRPRADRLTEFYFLISLGGVLGGLFNALVAPEIFNALIEYPLVLLLALAIPWRSPGDQRAVPFGYIALVTGAALAMLGAVWLFGHFDALHQERTFFGIHRITVNDDLYTLQNGPTEHGLQRRNPEQRAEPLSYYHRAGPAGQAFEAFAAVGPIRDVAVVGLGTGALAAYGEPGQTFTFFEIDPAVIDIATDARFFTYLGDSAAAIDIVLGDGRRQIDRVPDGSFDVIILDAFTSGSIPLHLMTREAFETYLAKLRPNGALLLHISNNHVDLEPVVGSISEELGLAALIGRDLAPSEPDQSSSVWAVAARRADAFGALPAQDTWRALETDARFRTWTDEYSTILSVLRADNGRTALKR